MKPTSATPAGYPDLVKVRTPVGSKDVWGVNGVRPRCQDRVLPWQIGGPWGCGAVRTRDLVWSCDKGDPSCPREVCLGEC